MYFTKRIFSPTVLTKLTKILSPKFLSAIMSTLFITVLLLAPSEWFPLWVDELVHSVPYGDKIAHVIALAGLSVALTLLLPLKRMWVLLAMVIYSCTTEIIQPVTGRTESWGDLSADFIGLACCCIIFLVFDNAKNRSKLLKG